MAYQLTVIMMNPEAMLGPLAKSLNTASLIGIQILSMALAPMLLSAGRLLRRRDFPSCFSASWK